MRYEYSRSTSIYMKATSASSEEITGYVKWDPPSSSLPAPPAHTLINTISGSEYMIGADRALFQSMSTEHIRPSTAWRRGENIGISVESLSIRSTKERGSQVHC
jgi:hypothetical protein